MTANKTPPPSHGKWTPPGGRGLVVGINQITKHQREYHVNGPCHAFKGMVCPLQWVSVLDDKDNAGVTDDRE